MTLDDLLYDSDIYFKRLLYKYIPQHLYLPQKQV
jgi:hypothetical protein